MRFRDGFYMAIGWTLGVAVTKEVSRLAAPYLIEANNKLKEKLNDE